MVNEEKREKPWTSGWPLRATVYGAVWLPLFGLIAVTVPKFEPTFHAMGARAELPAITDWLLWFSVLNETLFFSPFLIIIVLLIVVDVVAEATLKRYWVWLIGISTMGILAVSIAMFALMLPLLRMSATL